MEFIAVQASKNGLVTASGGSFKIEAVEDAGSTVKFFASPTKWKDRKKMQKAVCEKQLCAADEAETIAAAEKTLNRNRTYVQKMLSLPKLVFTEQVNQYGSVIWMQ